jgi:DNA-binding Lrp family transcriptional regulator
MGNYNFKGENNNYCKLSDKDVGLIREMAKNTNITYRKLANIFGVSHAHIYKVVKGKTRA